MVDRQLSPNKERLLVADSMTMQLLVFNRSLENGALKLRQRITMPGSPDNLELDLYRGDIELHKGLKDL